MRYIPLNEAIEGIIVNKKEYGVFVELNTWHCSGLLHAMRMVGETRFERDSVLDAMEISDSITVYISEIELVEGNLKLKLSQSKLDETACEIVASGVDEGGSEVVIAG